MWEVDVAESAHSIELQVIQGPQATENLYFDGMTSFCTRVLLTTCTSMEQLTDRRLNASSSPEGADSPYAALPQLSEEGRRDCDER